MVQSSLRRHVARTRTRIGHNVINVLALVLAVFVRLKKARGRRYAYLVEGKRDGGRVRQRVVCYLGPMARLALGVPEETARSLRDSGIDPNDVGSMLRSFPLTFEELAEARRLGLGAGLGGRGTRDHGSGSRRRATGEDRALFALASSKFSQAFTEIGPLRYRMR